MADTPDTPENPDGRGDQNNPSVPAEQAAPGTPSPTVRLRRLSIELARLREACGLTRDEVARRLEWSPSKISRIEAGKWARPNPRDVRDLLDVYGVTDTDRREALVTLARQARTRAWWEAYTDVVSGQYVGLEAEATSIRCYRPLIVPDLLQAEEYTRAIVEDALVADPREAKRRVEAVKARQERLAGDRPIHLFAVLDEAVLRRPVGGVDAMRKQLAHLKEMARRPGVELRVMPRSAGAYLGMGGPMTLLGFPQSTDPDIVYFEDLAGERYVDGKQVDRCGLLFDHMCALALDVDDTVALIDTAAREMS